MQKREKGRRDEIIEGRLRGDENRGVMGSKPGQNCSLFYLHAMGIFSLSPQTSPHVRDHIVCCFEYFGD